MDEIISGVQVIKMYAWEKPFCAMVELARKLELRVVTKSSYIRGIYMTLNLFTTRMALYCTLVTMLMFGNELTVDKAFVVSSYLNVLAQTMTGTFVRGFAELAECMVAIRRLQSFLLFDEFQDSSISKTSFEYVNISSNQQTYKQEGKEDLPFIDDDVEDYQNLNENNDYKKQNGIMILASDLLKNATDLIEGKFAKSSVLLMYLSD